MREVAGGTVRTGGVINTATAACCETFSACWDRAVRQHGEAPAFITLNSAEDHGETVSFARLDGEANGLARRLASDQATPVLLWVGDAYHKLLGLLACMKAGRAGVPVPYRSRGENGPAEHIGHSLGACAVLHAPQDGARARRHFPHAQPVELVREMAAELFSPDPRPGDLAYLQFTSGSTSAPRGVRILQRNLMANIAAIADRFALTAADRYCHWLPLYHDMGLVTTLTGLAHGCPTYHLDREHFARRPLDWLRAVELTGATCTGAPNFALERCAGRQQAAGAALDLSAVRLLFCGAEPISAATFSRFTETFAASGFCAEALAPCYGLAEATLMVSGGQYRPRRDRLTVPCGTAVAGTVLRIVDPDTARALPEGEEGEIWVSGPSIGDGHHGGPLDRDRFAATIAGESELYLRTGDLGCLEGGRLLVRGRLRDMVVHEGRNIHLCDIESGLAARTPAAGGARAAVALAGERIGLVQEARCRQGEAALLARSLAEAVFAEHGVSLWRILIVPPGTIPLTTSGKVRRSQCRELFEREPAQLLASWPESVEALDGRPMTEDEQLIADLLRQVLPRGTVLDAETRFVELGLSSSRAAELLHRLAGRTHVAFDTSVLEAHGSIAGLARLLAAARRGDPATQAALIAPEPGYRSEARAPLAAALAALKLDDTYVAAEGDWLVRADASRVLDLVGGFGTTLFGHNHPELIGAMMSALKDRAPLQAQGSIRGEAGRLAAALSSRLGTAVGRDYSVSLWNTGAEAVEAAMRHMHLAYDARARAWLAETDGMAHEWALAGDTIPPSLPGMLAEAGLACDGAPDRAAIARLLAGENRRRLRQRVRFLCLSRGFHGKTAGAAALTDSQSLGLYGEGEPRAERIAPDDPAALARAFAANRVVLLRLGPGGTLQQIDWSLLAGLLVEPVQSEGGVQELSPAAAERLARLASQEGVPLAADEIQCGFGRCGTFTVSERIGLRPDYVLLGKAMGGGVAKLAAMAAPRGEDHGFAMLHSSTYADDDISARVGLAALDLLEREGLAQRAARLGDNLLAMLERIRAACPAGIRAVRGSGCLIGVELQLPGPGTEWIGHDLGKLAASFLLNRHAIRTLPTLSAPHVLRIEPSAFLCSEAIERVERAFTDLARTLATPGSQDLFAHLYGGGRTDPPAAPQGLAPVAAASSPPAPRVAFISYLVDPAGLRHLDPRFAALSDEQCEALLRRLFGQLEPRIARRHCIVSPRGGEVELLTVGLLMTSGQIAAALSRGEGGLLRRQIRQAVRVAEEEGCLTAGLAGYLSILANNGLDVVQPELAVTTGNALTAAALLHNLEQGAREQGLDLARCRAAVVGAGGNIGSYIASQLAGRVAVLDLVGRHAGSPALITLANRLARGDARVLASDITALRKAQVVVSVTSAPQPVIHARLLGPDCRLVCDAAVPGDIDPALAAARPDILVSSGAAFAIPGAEQADFTLGALPPGHAFACLAETVLLGLDPALKSTLGRIRHHQAAALMKAALEHGFTPVSH